MYLVVAKDLLLYLKYSPFCGGYSFLHKKFQTYNIAFTTLPSYYSVYLFILVVYNFKW